MKKPASIQLHIPKPCNEDWDRMSEIKEGRYCNNCQHAVIDFTKFTDVQLYNFTVNHKNEHICGRFRLSQLNRAIPIPPQPHSMLYRLVIAAGLTILALVPMHDTSAKFRAPLIIENILVGDEAPKPGDNTITITGTVMNTEGRLVPHAGLNLYKNGVRIMSTFAYSDDGHFEFAPISYVEWSEIEFEVFAYKYERVIIKVDLNNLKSSYNIQMQIDSAALKAKMPEGIFYTGEVGYHVAPPEKVNGEELHKRSGDIENRDYIEVNNPFFR